jgi:mono/diheme cytochrome c family protein
MKAVPFQIPIRLRAPLLFSLLLCLATTAGCALELDLDFDLDMRHQPRMAPLDASAFFEDGASARPPVPGTVARGQLHLDDLFYTGREGIAFAQTFPITITAELLERGQERYQIYCTPCHGQTGEGDGTIIEYGMPAPPSLHDPELAARQHGYYFAIITNGTRVMPRYAPQIPPEDRWAIVAYMRALQLTQSTDLSQVSPEDIQSPD